MRNLSLTLVAVIIGVFPSGAAAEPEARLQLNGIAADLGFHHPITLPVPGVGGGPAPWSRTVQLENLSRLPAPDTTVRFVILGDIEPGRFWFTRMWAPKKDAFERQARALALEEPDFILQLGDVVSRGTTENYRKLESTLEEVITRPFFPVIGNHDRPKTHGHSDKSLFNDVFGQGDFFFDRGGYRFILLDNSNWELTRSQLDWLDAALSTPLKTVVSMHIPPTFLRGRFVKPHKAPKDAPLKIKESVGWFATGAIEFGDLMTRHGVERVYLGHIHTLAYADYQGVRYVLSGGGGSPLYRAPNIPGKKTSHYIVVEAGPNGITERIETLKGKTLSFLNP